MRKNMIKYKKNKILLELSISSKKEKSNKNIKNVIYRNVGI